MKSHSRILALTLVLATTSARPLAAEEAEDGIFADPALEAAARTYVFDKRSSTEPLTAEDVADLSQIVARGKSIRRLDGIEHCKKLMLLDLADNEVSDLTPLKDLKLLQSLTLARNKIADISPLAGLTRLQYLELSENQVEDIAPLAGLTALNSLYLGGNRVSDISPLAGLTRLWSLYLPNNRITDIGPLAGLARLSSLNLDHNQIVDLSALGGLRQLMRLSLRHNRITDVSVLVEMADKDAAGENRFARYWSVALGGNPLGEAAKSEQIKKLSEYSLRIDAE